MRSSKFRSSTFPLFIITMMLVAALSTSSCSVVSAPYNSFFAWMNCYIAMPEKSEWTMSLTFFSDSDTAKDFKSNLVNVEFDGLSEQIPISKYIISDLSTAGQYSSYGFEITFSSTDKGVFHTNNLILTRSDNTRIACGIGDWYFDVDESPSDIELLDTYGSPGASSNREDFPYLYEKKNQGVIIYSIKYGENLSVSNESGLEIEDKLTINNTAPVTYIRARIEILNNGTKETCYAMGCYCGALGFNDRALAESKEHCKVIKVIST